MNIISVERKNVTQFEFILKKFLAKKEVKN